MICNPLKYMSGAQINARVHLWASAASLDGLVRIGGTYHAWRGDKGTGYVRRSEATSTVPVPFTARHGSKKGAWYVSRA
jgi:hypothetical protein